jgi:hypothetical protein
MHAIPARPRDTTAEAAQAQAALFRAVPVSRRLRAAFGLSATVIGAARAALARSEPDASNRERALRFVALHYGHELAAGLRADLERRERPANPASDLVAALRPVVEAFDALGIRYYVGGSVASSAHGLARASLDADVVAEIEPAHVDALVSRFEHAYYVPVERLRTAARERTSFNLIHLATMFKIDVFVSRDRDFDRQAASRARPQMIDDTPGGFAFRVASPEDTILAKLEWFRPGGETSERQWWDVVGIIRVTAATDREYLRTWGTALGVADLVERALSAASDES